MKQSRYVRTARKNKRPQFCDTLCAKKDLSRRARDKTLLATEKVCNTCKAIKPLDNFYNAKRGKHGKQYECKLCADKRNKCWAQSHKTVAVSYNKKYLYGLTSEREAEILESQDGVCAICGCDPPLCVDHCHTTGIVRGLLCRTCNTGLGSFSDNLKGILKAVAYLERSNADND